MRIPIKEIWVGERQRKEMKNIEELAESFKTFGQITPIAVRPTNAEESALGQTAPWRLVAGGRRMAAAMFAGWLQIEATDLKDLSPYKRAAIELEENLQREGLTMVEELEAKAAIHALYQLENPGQSIRETARELGESHANLVRDLQLHALMQIDPELKKETTKKGALRKAAFKQEIKQRIASIRAVDVSDLRERLVAADMRDYVKRLPDKSVDLVFCDFPFGIDWQDARYSDKPGEIRDLLTDVVPHIVRIVKPSGWICCMMGYTHFRFLEGLFGDACATHLAYAGEHDAVVDEEHLCRYLKPEEIPWIWYRENSRNPSMHPDRHAQNVYEMFCVVNGGHARLIKPCKNVLDIPAEYDDRLHEAQRPLALCEEIISRFTLPGELVVDLCFGSGSALAAAAKMGRQFLGCDIDPQNVDRALTYVARYHNKVTPITAARSAQKQTVATPEPEPSNVAEDVSALMSEAFGSLGALDDA